MKANELQICDWVQIVEPCKYAGAIGRVKTLIDHKNDENAYFKVFLKNNTIHIGIEDICSDDISPIPLTPEILEKNGFTRRAYGYSIDNLKLLGNLTGDDVVYFTIKISSFEKRVNYVHELQHALRLCGIDKEIEL